MKEIVNLHAEIVGKKTIKYTMKPVLDRYKRQEVNNTNYTEEILYWKCQSCGYRLPHKLYEQSKMDYGCPTCGNSYAYFTSVVK